MTPTSTRIIVAAIAAGGLAPTLMGAGEGNPPHLTPIEDVVMYGINVATSELLRYDFGADEYTIRGVVKLIDGTVVTGVKSMGLVPYGDHRGLYAIANMPSGASRLVRIGVLDAAAELTPLPVGFGQVQGLSTLQVAGSTAWDMFAYAGTPQKSIVRIDAASGAGTLVHLVTHDYQSLAMTSDGMLYGTAGTPAQLWMIDATGAETLVGQLATQDGGTFVRVGALERAFGDDDDRIKIPLQGQNVVPDSWTMGGILFGLSTETDSLLIINHETGEVVPWMATFTEVDCEAMVFTTKHRDVFEPVVNSND